MLIELPGHSERYDASTRISRATERYLIAFPRFRRTVGLIWHVTAFPDKETSFTASVTRVHENTETVMHELWAEK